MAIVAVVVVDFRCCCCCCGLTMAFGEFVSATDAMNDGTHCAHNNNDNEDSKMVKTGTMLGFFLEASSKKVVREQKEVFFFVLWQQREKTKDEDQFLSDKFVVK